VCIFRVINLTRRNNIMPYLLNLRQINILPPNENTAEEIAKVRRDIADVMGMDVDDIELLTEDIEED